MIIFLLLISIVYSLKEITIYIESLCPDTISTMKKISDTTIQSLDKLAIVKFIPAGKFGERYDRDDDISPFYQSCQHGSKECFGNIVLSCGLQYINNQIEQTKFIRCFYQHVQSICQEKEQCFNNSINQCLTNQQKYQVIACSHGPQGIELLFQNQNETNNLNYVPSYNFGDIMKSLDQDFGRLICKQQDAPEICSTLKW